MREYACAVHAVGDLRRTVLGASGVALLLPIALVLALAGTAALGGGAGFRALSQVLAGPPAPGGSDSSRPLGLESARTVPPVPPRAAPQAQPTRRSAPAGSTAPRPHPAHRTPSGDNSSRRPTPSRRPAGTPTASGTTPAAPPASPPPTTPPAGETPVHAAAQGAADAVRQLPAPVGPPAGDAAQTVVDLLP